MNSEIFNIVGSGIFGLSTAYWLSQRNPNYSLNVFDRIDLPSIDFDSTTNIADGASCDLNKIFRVSYGSDMLYQDLALEAMAKWNEWNEEIKEGKYESEGFSKEDILFVNCGYLRVFEDDLDQYEKDTLNSMEKSDLRHIQVLISNKNDMKRIRSTKWSAKMDPFNKYGKEPYISLLETTGGFTFASKATKFLYIKCKERPNIQFHYGPEVGFFEALVNNEHGEVTGIKTKDGKIHNAGITLIACGGWTSYLVPEVRDIVEATCGSVSIIQLPKGNSELWEKFSPENLPVWSVCNGNIYGFPRDEEGYLKFGFRDTKYTRYINDDHGKLISSPDQSVSLKDTQKITLFANNMLKKWVTWLFPELKGMKFTKSRLCWYSDSFDNGWIIDFVPGNKNLLVSCGDSGHGFKHAPVVGKYIADVIERKTNKYTELFKWRVPNINTEIKNISNNIYEGPSGFRNLKYWKLTEEDDTILDNPIEQKITSKF